MYSQVSNLFLPKLPCTRFQSVIEISLVSCVCRFSLCLLFQCLKMFHRVHLHAKGGCVTQCQPEDTHREFNPATNMNYSSNPPSLQKGEGQLIPSLTFVQRYGRLREWLWTPLSLHSRAYFNPPPFNTKQDSSPSDRPRKTKLLAFTPLMSITTIYTNKYMDI